MSLHDARIQIDADSMTRGEYLALAAVGPVPLPDTAEQASVPLAARPRWHGRSGGIALTHIEVIR